MGNPRKVSVSISIGASGTAIDVTNDLIAFSFEEAIQCRAQTMDITLDDASHRYRNDWFIPKGTEIQATITTSNWLVANDSATRSTGKMYVDTVHLDLKPAQVVIKANSVSPALQRAGVKHRGSEGASVQDSISQTASLAKYQAISGLTGDSYGASSAGTESAGGSGSIPGATASNTADDTPITEDDKRSDQDSESDLAYACRKAAEKGCQIMVVDGKIVSYKESDLEAKKPYKILTDGISPIIRGKFTTTALGKVHSGKYQYLDPKTGALSSATFTPAQPVEGTETVLNTRERPPWLGKDDNNPVVPGTAIDTGQPDDPFAEDA